jgi:acylphosphatase
MKHHQITISGKVENTGFRFYAFWGASIFGIKGLVQLKDGRVIIDAEGEDVQLNDFGEWCKRGPDGSEVDSLTCTEKSLDGYEDFKIL